MVSVAEFLQKFEPSEVELPVFHNTDFSGLQEIVGRRTIDPRSVSSQGRVYVASGRPYYMRPSERSKINLDGAAGFSIAAEYVTSISFMMRGDFAILRASPFDTGRFLKGEFEGEAAYFCKAPLNGESRREFLDNRIDISAIPLCRQRHIAAMFGSNEDYLWMRSRKELADNDNPNDATEYTSTLVYRSSKRRKPIGFDLSAQTVELQLNSISIEYLKGAIVFVPVVIMEKYPDFIEEVRGMVQAVEGYPVSGGTPSAYLRSLISAARTYMKKNHLI